MLTGLVMKTRRRGAAGARQERCHRVRPGPTGPRPWPRPAPAPGVRSARPPRRGDRRGVPRHRQGGRRGYAPARSATRARTVFPLPPSRLTVTGGRMSGRRELAPHTLSSTAGSSPRWNPRARLRASATGPGRRAERRTTSCSDAMTVLFSQRFTAHLASGLPIATAFHLEAVARNNERVTPPVTPRQAAAPPVPPADGAPAAWRGRIRTPHRRHHATAARRSR